MRLVGKIQGHEAAAGHDYMVVGQDGAMGPTVLNPAPDACESQFSFQAQADLLGAIFQMGGLFRVVQQAIGGQVAVGQTTDRAWLSLIPFLDQGF